MGMETPSVLSFKPSPELRGRLSAAHADLAAANPDVEVSMSDLLRKVVVRGLTLGEVRRDLAAALDEIIREIADPEDSGAVARVRFVLKRMGE